MIISKIKCKEKNLGGFTVRRFLPSETIKMVGPWIFFDHLGPAYFRPGEGINVRPHPHIGLCTVTYLFDGEIEHKDSLGTNQTIKPGDVNLMVAGNGIVHSERENPDFKNSHHIQHGLQLWLALPEDKEDIDPEFHHYNKSVIPSVDSDGINIKLIIGKAFGTESPVKTFSETIFIEANLSKGNKLTIPITEEIAIYVLEGSIEIIGERYHKHDMVVIKSYNDLSLNSLLDSKLIVLGGDNIGERFISWNFVSSSKEKIENSKHKWKNRDFPVIIDDAEEFIPLPEL